MGEMLNCLECGARLPADSGLRLCARCRDRAALSATRTYSPAERAGGTTPPANVVAVGLADFRRAAIELGLLDAEQLDRTTADLATADVWRVAATLVRANRLTQYQAAALVQGKAKGLVVGPYIVLTKCGQGGMGVVFKVRHRPTGQVVALKILPPSFAGDSTAVQRFRREVAAAARLDHPNIVQILDANQDRGVHFLAMEFIEGRDLKAIVTSRGPLPVDKAIDCTVQAARGLEVAHEKGIVHRDIKPANLMLDASGVVRVLDLGLARLIEATDSLGRTATESLTQAGSYMGTVDFSAPEQADDAKTVDHRADIYSLGCTLYFLLVGRPPFDGDSMIKKLMAHQNRPAPSLHSARSDVPAPLEAAYQAMMVKQPAHRPQSMTEVIGLLESCRKSAVIMPKTRPGLITFDERRPPRSDPAEWGRGLDAAIPSRHGPVEDQPFDPGLGLDVLELEVRPEEGRPADLPRLRSGPRPSRLAQRSLGVGAFAVLGLALAGAMLFPRAARGPTPAVATPISHLAAKPKASAVAVKSKEKPDRSTTSPEPRVTVSSRTDTESPANPPELALAQRTPARPRESAESAESAGFRPVFNGRDLAGWKGQVGDYEVRDGVIRSTASQGTVIFFDRKLTDFVARVEFRLSRGSDGGLAIRYPGVGNPAYSAMCEIQILDDSAPTYAKLDPRQYCGSAFGIVAARRGHLRPRGEWNLEEVTVRGSTIKVELNGAVILDTDLSHVENFLSNTPHPGKDLASGYFGLSDAGIPVDYRRIEIRVLKL